MGSTSCRGVFGPAHFDPKYPGLGDADVGEAAECREDMLMLRGGYNMVLTKVPWISLGSAPLLTNTNVTFVPRPKSGRPHGVWGIGIRGSHVSLHPEGNSR